jgi:predicted amidohydrolase YtcJ
MTRMDALKSYTINGAYASFQDENLGSLKIGKLADIAVLSKDLLSVPDYVIKNTKVEMTIVGGKIEYEKE